VVCTTSFDEKTQLFTVVSRNLNTMVETLEEFDWIVVASGHFSTPNMPDWPGFDKFEGRILHTHDFRDACEFKSKDILTVGTSYSAEDIASQCFKCGVGSVTCSWRTNAIPWKWPANFSTIPLLERVEGSTCFFKDGTYKQIDAIILCTGYQHHFLFLPDELRLHMTYRLWYDELYNGIFLEMNPKIMYLGMQNQ
jgi:trimethylamine monooxygenase